MQYINAECNRFAAPGIQGGAIQPASARKDIFAEGEAQACACNAQMHVNDDNKTVKDASATSAL